MPDKSVEAENKLRNIKTWLEGTERLVEEKYAREKGLDDQYYNKTVKFLNHVESELLLIKHQKLPSHNAGLLQPENILGLIDQTNLLRQRIEAYKDITMIKKREVQDRNRVNRALKSAPNVPKRNPIAVQKPQQNTGKKPDVDKLIDQWEILKNKVHRELNSLDKKPDNWKSKVRDKVAHMHSQIKEAFKSDNKKALEKESQQRFDAQFPSVPKDEVGKLKR